MDNNILLTEKISKLFIKFSIPSVIAMSVTGTQALIDGIFLGKFVGTNALASVNIAQPFMALIIGVSLIIAIGAVSLIGRSLGEGNTKKAQDACKSALLITLAASLVIMLFGVLFNRQIASFLGANDVLIDNTALYIRNLAFCSVFMAFSLVLGVFTRVIGRPDIAMKANILSLVINIILNTLLIRVLNLGVFGASLATGLAFASGFFISIIPFLNKKTVINLYSGKFNFEYSKDLLANGSSEGVGSLAAATTSFVFNLAFMRIAGEDGVSAFTAISYISIFANLITGGIAAGIGPIISYNYGAKQYDRIKEILKLSSIISVSLGAIIFTGIMLFKEDLIGLFVSSNPKVFELALNGAKIYALAFLFNGLNVIYSGYFTSIGKALASIVVAASRGIVFIIIGVMIMPRLFGINGVWATVPCAELLTLAIV
ncbi:MAG: MATE family efflux transporter, partial [Peptostreptococcaceae bacterium]